MCYAIPAIVENIKGKVATISYFGERKEALCELIDLSCGDYVYAQGGYIIQKLAPEEAKKILLTWEDLFFELQEIDASGAALGNIGVSVDASLQAILERARGETKPTLKEGVKILNLESRSDQMLVSRNANYLRQKYHKNSCCVHGILEISNQCVRNCAYCGISALSQVPRYRMSFDEIMDAVQEAVNKFGFKSLVLQSGQECGYTIDELVNIVAAIKKQYPVLIFISFGEVGQDGLRRLYDAGARGILLRFETSNEALYKKLHPGYELRSRLEHLKAAYEMGYLVATGSLVGLPGQTKEDLVNDIILTSLLHADMFSFGPFLPHPSTPLANCVRPTEDDVLGVLALARFMCGEKVKILITTAYETLSAAARANGLASGGNSIMINVTPLKYRQLYSIYPHRAHENETIALQVRQALSELKSLGRGPTDLGS